MANIIGPRGLVPSRYLNGAAWNGSFNTYVIPSTDGSVFSVGDAVKTAANGDANGLPAVAKAAAGDSIRGVIVGVQLSMPNNPSLVGTVLDNSIQNIPATKAKDYYVMVVDDPMVLFEIQDDGVTAANCVATSCNKNANIVVTNPTAPQQNSATTLNSNTINTTQAFALRIMGLVQKPNNAYGAYASWLVKINQHELEGNTAGV